MASNHPMQKDSLLIELRFEELPAAYLDSLITQFTQALLAGFAEFQLHLAQYQVFSTPRRLGFLAESVPEEIVLPGQEVKGPNVSSAKNAFEAWLSKYKITSDQAYEISGPKGAYWAFKQSNRRIGLPGLLTDVITKALESIRIPKTMRWGLKPYRFARPLRGVTVLWGPAVVPVEIWGCLSERFTQGHRTLSSPFIQLASAQTYRAQLEGEGFVLADRASRQSQVKSLLAEIEALKSVKRVDSDALLEEVVDLVEWPILVLGALPAIFKSLPDFVTIEVLSKHQKMFTFRDSMQRLSPYYGVICNGFPGEVSAVRRGYERVIDARLKDAAFLVEEDRKGSWERYLEATKDLVLHPKLGSVWDKTQRLLNLIDQLAAITHVDPSNAKRAALLSKADLATQLVFEMPKLQGAFGSALAQERNESDAVVKAIASQYLPDPGAHTMPLNLEGFLLALSDKVDHLVGFAELFGLPKGHKDPFALRRTALAIFRLLQQPQLKTITLSMAIEAAIKTLGLPKDQLRLEGLKAFVQMRAMQWYEQNKVPRAFFAAVKEKLGFEQLYEFDLAINNLCQSVKPFNDNQRVFKAFKRLHQFLRQVEGQIPKSCHFNLPPTLGAQDLVDALQALPEPSTLKIKDLSDLAQKLEIFLDTVFVFQLPVSDRNLLLSLLQAVHEAFDATLDFSSLLKVGYDPSLRVESPL